MKVKQLIDELKYIFEQHGNIEVHTFDDVMTESCSLPSLNKSRDGDFYIVI